MYNCLQVRNSSIFHSLDISNNTESQATTAWSEEHATAAQTIPSSSHSLFFGRNLGTCGSCNGSEKKWSLCYNTRLRKCDHEKFPKYELVWNCFEMIFYSFCNAQTIQMVNMSWIFLPRIYIYIYIYNLQVWSGRQFLSYWQGFMKDNRPPLQIFPAYSSCSKLWLSRAQTRRVTICSLC